MEIIKRDEKNECGLAVQYTGQTNTQDIYLYVDTEGEKVWIDYDPEIGGAVTFDIWHGRTRRYRIYETISATGANNLLDNETLIALAERIIAGTEVKWDGNNYVGILDDDAISADEEMEQYVAGYTFQESETVSLWDAGDFFTPLSADEVMDEVGLKITTETTDQEIAEAARKYEESMNIDSATGGPMELSGVENYLLNIREELITERDSNA
jgi:hypothetical protein